MFLNFWSHILFLLGLEVVTIASVNCKNLSSVTCDALWEEFKMVDDRKTVTFFRSLYIHKLSHKELLY